jgi:hypothetical protein
LKLKPAFVVFPFFTALSVLAEQSELSRQSDAHQMFSLRDELSKHPALPNDDH